MGFSLRILTVRRLQRMIPPGQRSRFVDVVLHDALVAAGGQCGRGEAVLVPISLLERLFEADDSIRRDLELLKQSMVGPAAVDVDFGSVDDPSDGEIGPDGELVGGVGAQPDVQYGGKNGKPIKNPRGRRG